MKSIITHLIIFSLIASCISNNKETSPLFTSKKTTPQPSTDNTSITEVFHYCFKQGKGDLNAFSMEGPGTFIEANGKVTPALYGSEKAWYGPKAILPVTVQGDFRLDANINYQSEGRQMGKIILGVVLESGMILKFMISDRHTLTVEHSLDFVHGDTSVWSSGIKRNNKTFSDYPIAIERHGNLLKCLAGGQLVGSKHNSDESAVKQVFFTIEHYEYYPVLTQASIGQLSLSRLNI